MYVRSAFLCMATIVLTFVLTSSFAFGAEEKVIPKGSRPATKDDLEWMKWAGIPDPKEGMTINPSDPNIGQEVGAVKEWLNKHAVKGARVRCLNPQFAKQLKALMEANPYGPPTITSAYRTVAEQQNIINKGYGTATRVSTPCGSWHPWGLAADFNQKGEEQKVRWQRENVAKFGLARLGEWDPYHVQSPGKSGQCGGCSLDGADGVVAANVGGGGGSPTQNFAQQLRQWLNPQQQPATQPPPPIQQPLQQTQPLLKSFQEPVSEKIEPTSAAPTQMSQPSIADKLEGLAFEKKQDSPATTTHATSVPVYLDGSDVGGVASKGKAEAEQPVTATAGIGGSVTQSTFGSDSLTWEDSRADITGFQAILFSIRERLQAILARLTPFGGRSQPHPDHSGEIYLE